MESKWLGIFFKNNAQNVQEKIKQQMTATDKCVPNRSLVNQVYRTIWILLIQTFNP